MMLTFILFYLTFGLFFTFIWSAEIHSCIEFQQKLISYLPKIVRNWFMAQNNFTANTLMVIVTILWPYFAYKSMKDNIPKGEP